MAEEHGSHEKTEQATPRRLQQARERGDVARSRELNTMTLLLVASGSLLVMGERIFKELSEVMRRSFLFQREQLFDPYAPMTFFVDAVLHMLGTLTPFLAAMALVALIGPILMGGWVFSVQALGFKWERLNPFKGLGRVFGLKGLMEMAKAFAKFALAGVSVLLLWLSMGELL